MVPRAEKSIEKGDPTEVIELSHKSL
jgi:hypothetical protein